MAQILDRRTEAWVLDRLGDDVATVTAVTPLAGGLSEAMFRIELAGADLPAVVLRRWPRDVDWTREAVRREAAALSLLSGTGLGAPEIIASDPVGTGTGRPATLMTVVPGVGDLGPSDPDRWSDRMAGRLVAIHDVRPADDLLPGERFADLDDPDRQAWMARLPVGAAALELARAPYPDEVVFSHGDYQHFNLLWTSDRLTGVVDWPMACVDDRGRDVGHCMLNLAVLYSADRAMGFLDRYQAAAGTVVPVGSLLRELLDFNHGWPRFIPIQVDGRVPVDGAGMADRVEEVITRLVRRAG